MAVAGTLEIQLLANVARLQSDMGRATKTVGGAMSSIERSVSQAKNALLGMAGGFSLALVAREVLKTQREFDKLNASLVTATGSTANAAQAFKALQAFAATTPYSVQEATTAFIKMRNMGLDPSEKALRAYGNTSAAMGKSLEQMIEAVADAATGEFERLKEFGIKAKVEGDKVALTFQGNATTIGNNAQEIEKYLQRIGEVEFGGGMALRAATLDGAISNLGDTWSKVMLTIAQGGIGAATQQSVIDLSSALTDLDSILNAVNASYEKAADSGKEVGFIHKGLTTIFETVAVLGIDLAYVLTGIGNELGGLAAQAAAILTGNFSEARTIGEMMKADAEAARIAVDARMAAILGASAKTRAAAQAEAEDKARTGRDDLARYKLEAKAKNELGALTKEQIAAAKKLADSQTSFITGLEKEVALLGSTGEQQKLYEASVLKITGTRLAAVQSLISQVAAFKDAEEATKTLKEANQALLDVEYQRITAYEATLPTLLEANKAMAQETELIGLSETAQLAVTQARQASTIAIKEEQLARLQNSEFMSREQIALEYEIELLKERMELSGARGARQAEAGGLKDVAAYLDPAKAVSFGDALKGSIDGAMNSMVGLGNALEDYLKKNKINADMQAKAAKNPDEAKRIKDLTALREDQAEIQIAAYGDMAGAAKSFFKQGSDGYRVLNGIEQAMHALTLANQYEKLFTSMFVSSATAAGVVAGQAVETTAVVAGEAVRNTAKTPGVFMSFMSALGPWGAAAAAVAIAAVLGGGSKGAPSISMDAFAAQKANDGTGTVMGDPNAQSESIQNSLEALEDYAKPSLLFTSQMVGLLRSINNSLAGATSSLLSSGFDAFGNQFRGSSSASGGGIAGAIFGSSSSSTSLSDLGLSFGVEVQKIEEAFRSSVSLVDGQYEISRTAYMRTTKEIVGQTIGEAMQAVGLQQYEVTRTDSSSSGFLGFGGGSSTSYNTTMSAVDAKVSETMTLAVRQMFEIVSTAASQIGVTQDKIDALQSLDTGLGKISLKDKTGQEIQELLTAVFSAMGDTMAATIAPGLKDMQLAGEGLLETLTRVTNGLSITNDWARIFGQSMFEMSLAGAKSANVLAEAFGGLENLNSQSQAFYEAFYSDTERAAESQRSMAVALGSVNLTLPATKDAFRALAIGLDLTTDAGRAAYAMMLSLAPTFADTADMLAEIAEAGIDAAQDLVADAMDALGRAVDAERNTITDAYESQSASVQASLDVVGESVGKLQSLASTLKSTLDGLRIIGSDASFRRSAQSDISAALAQARTGGGLPLDGQLDSALRTVAQPSEQLFASFEDYARDFYRTANDIASLSGLTETALTADQVQQRQMIDQLALLTRNHADEMTRLDGIISTAQAQIDAVNSVNTSVLTVAQAIANLSVAINLLGSAQGAASQSGGGVIAATAASYVQSLEGRGAGASQAANPVSAFEQSISDIYSSTLGRTADAGGLAYWAGSGMSIAEIAGGIAASEEKAMRDISVSAQNTFIDLVNSAYGQKGLQAFAVGTNYVPNDMQAQIHQGERIIPAADNRELMQRLSNPQANNEALISEIRELRREVQGLRIEAQATASHTNKTARLLDRAMPSGTAIATEAVTS